MRSVIYGVFSMFHSMLVFVVPLVIFHLFLPSRFSASLLQLLRHTGISLALKKLLLAFLLFVITTEHSSSNTVLLSHEFTCSQ